MFNKIIYLGAVAGFVSPLAGYAQSADWKARINSLERTIKLRLDDIERSKSSYKTDSEKLNAAQAESEKLAQAEIDKKSEEIRKKYKEKFLKANKALIEDVESRGQNLPKRESNFLAANKRTELKIKNLNKVGPKFDEILKMPIEKLPDAQKACDAITSFTENIQAVAKSSRPEIPNGEHVYGNFDFIYHLQVMRNKIKSKNFGMSCKDIGSAMKEIGEVSTSTDVEVFVPPSK
jgi:tRNA U34 5-carboxymethylaminomethyl modifying enzyme MnmG/GidA